MKIAVITECDLCRAHGTGAQIMTLMAGMGVDYYHFHLKRCHDTDSEIANSKYLGDRELPIPKVRRVWKEIRDHVVGPWWESTSLNVSRFQRFLSAKNLEFDAAYVVVASDEDAARAGEMIRVLGCPYILHVVDIYHRDGLEPAAMTGFRSLMDEAQAVFALTPAIRDELLKFANKPVTQIFDGQEISAFVSAPPKEGEAVRIIMGGRPYAGGSELLASAIPSLAKLNRRFEIQYVGPHFIHLPAELRSATTNIGFLSVDGEYRNALAQAHIAFLSGPNDLDQYGKYSFPSRTTEFLMAGLPVVGCVAEGSATERVLAPITPGAFRIVRTIEQLASAMIDFSRDAQSWEKASASARQFAIENFSIAKKRDYFLSALKEACQGVAA